MVKIAFFLLVSSKNATRGMGVRKRTYSRVALVMATVAALSIGALAGLAGPAGAARQRAGGGTITLGAEQEMDCADWISSCAGASWGEWTMQEYTMPRVFNNVFKGGKWVVTPNVLLASYPTVTTKGGKQVVTYKINPKAVWSDGKPITSTDFKYTADQIKNGTDIYDTTGYANIGSVDDSNPLTAVVTFDKPFGGGVHCSAPRTACSRATSSRARTATPRWPTVTTGRVVRTSPSGTREWVSH